MSGDVPDRAGREAPGRGASSDRFDDSTNQFYRAEMERMATWRTRLDQTTNWTVVVLAAILTWAFTSPDNPHYVLLVGMLAAVAFLLIEGQRYQEYDAWRARVRVLQREFFADVYAPDGVSAGGGGSSDERSESDGEDDRRWREGLGRDLRSPSVRIPYWEAVSQRLGHVYLPLLTILLAAWTVRITVFAPGPPVAAAAIERIPGVVVIAAVATVYLFAAALALWSLTRAPRREFDGKIDAIGRDEGA